MKYFERHYYDHRLVSKQNPATERLQLAAVFLLDDLCLATVVASKASISVKKNKRLINKSQNQTHQPVSFIASYLGVKQQIMQLVTECNCLRNSKLCTSSKSNPLNRQLWSDMHGLHTRTQIKGATCYHLYYKDTHKTTVSYKQTTITLPKRREHSNHRT